MKLLTTFLLVGLLALWMGFPSTTGSNTPTEGPVKQKPGGCPIDRCRCTGTPPNECWTDYGCEKKKKCCYSCCAMRCVDPK